MARPLISFIVVSYNQEAFIRDAVEGALAQSYSPLEIVISDDGSKDRTFEIAQEVVAGYRGPHSVRLNRNVTNLGMGRHINRVMELCHGELVVGSAGDDVSLPHRTDVVYRAWEDSGRRATSIFSSYITISAEGESLSVGGTRGNPADTTLHRPQEGSLFKFLSTEWPVVVGCSHAWVPALFEFFGPLSADLEDLVLSFRSLAIGKLLYVHQPLIKYRRHGANASFLAGGDDARSFEHHERRLRWVDEKHVAAYDNMLADIDILWRKGGVASDERDRLQVEAQRMRSYYSVERQMIDGSFTRRLATLANTVKQGNLRCALRSLPRALPRPVYRALYLLRDRWRSLVRTNSASAVER